MMQNMDFIKARINDMLKQADMMTRQIAIMKRLYVLQERLTAIAHHTVGLAIEMKPSSMKPKTISRISKTSSGRFEATSTGKSTATTFRYAGDQIIFELFDGLDGLAR